MEVLRRLIGGVWLGSAVFLMLAASAVFRAAPSATSAADVVGAMLTRWHYIALAAPLALFAFELRRSRPLILILLFTSVMLAAGQSLVDLRIRGMRMATAIPISSLDRQHPIRRHFGRLHGMSMGLLALQAIAAAIVVAARPKTEAGDVAVESAPSAAPPFPDPPSPAAAPLPQGVGDPLAGTTPAEPSAETPPLPAVDAEVDDDRRT